MAGALALKSLGLAALAGGLAIVSAFAWGAELRHRAALTSRQRPEEERLFEPATRTSPVLVATGRKIFLANCAHCHGADATGDEGPDLHDVQVSDRYIAHIIGHGIPHEMPSFARKLGGSEVTALTAYVRSLHSE